MASSKIKRTRVFKGKKKASRPAESSEIRYLASLSVCMSTVVIAVWTELICLFVRRQSRKSSRGSVVLASSSSSSVVRDSSEKDTSRPAVDASVAVVIFKFTQVCAGRDCIGFVRGHLTTDYSPRRTQLHFPSSSSLTRFKGRL